MEYINVDNKEEPELGYAQGMYANLESDRSSFLDRARSASELTIPSLLVDSGHSNSTVLATPFQSIGAEGVNNLSSKLLLSLLPPNAPFFRLVVDDTELENLLAEQRGEAEEALAE